MAISVASTSSIAEGRPGRRTRKIGGQIGRRQRRAPQRIETGVPNLDRILGGGLLRGSLAMVIGAPGAGKTVMAQQIAFHCAAQGKATLFLTGYNTGANNRLR
ncbi:MAG TPA: ATPase domain-containing protein [Chloroflexota bacterium]|nr:ATPase domain-containing protein [Chloroflexota bacterium]